MIIEGFSYAAIQAGIRYSNRLDLGLIYCETPAAAAGVFTANRVKAAPVQLDMQRIARGTAQAILINSGIANACTGEQGFEAAGKTAALAASALGISEEMVLVASTGVIGEQLEVAKFEQAMGGLAADLSPSGFGRVAEAMMTTDTFPKTAFRRLKLDGREVKLFGMAKGAGMIMPDMATMLCFVLTDARISTPVLDALLRTSVDRSFNRITVDGDTSTNDMVLVLANGRAGNRSLDGENTEEEGLFQEALNGLLKELALRIVEDGEGATKLVIIRVVGARNADEAQRAARTIANSPLVKTAFFGEDANWGRIIAALGRSGAGFDPAAVDIFFDEIMMVENGLGLGSEAEKRATAILKQDHFTVSVDLKKGNGESEIYTSDLSLEYVKINADYRS